MGVCVKKTVYACIMYLCMEEKWWLDRQTDGWMIGCMDGWIEFEFCLKYSISNLFTQLLVYLVDYFCLSTLAHTSHLIAGGAIPDSKHSPQRWLALDIRWPTGMYDLTLGPGSRHEVNLSKPELHTQPWSNSMLKLSFW